MYAAGLLEEVEVEQLRVSSPPDDAGDSSSSKTALEEERRLLARSLAASDDEVRFAFCFYLAWRSRHKGASLDLGAHV